MVLNLFMGIMNDTDFRDEVVRQLAKNSADHQAVKEDLAELKGMLGTHITKQDVINQKLADDGHAQDLRLTVIETKADAASSKSGKGLVAGLISILSVLAMVIAKLLGL